MVLLEEGSGSIRHEVERIGVDSGDLWIEIKSIVPEVGTCDMAWWHVLIEPEAGVEVESEKGITVVYTKEAQTADAYIEKTVRSLSGHHKVTVATSDRLEQIIIFGSGAYRLSASQLEQEVEKVERAVAETVEEHNLKTDSKVFSGDFAEKLLEWQKRNENEQKRQFSHRRELFFLIMSFVCMA